MSKQRAMGHLISFKDQETAKRFIELYKDLFTPYSKTTVNSYAEDFYEDGLYSLTEIFYWTTPLKIEHITEYNLRCRVTKDMWDKIKKAQGDAISEKYGKYYYGGD